MHVTERLARHLTKTPDIANALFIAPNATILGDVQLGKDSSVWYGAILRGDIEAIRIGEGTNIQDLTLMHLANDLPVHVGSYCTIGHSAIVHACEIGNECLIGMHSTVLDGAQIGDRCIVGAGALVTKSFRAPPGSMILGVPARVVRSLTADEAASLRPMAEKYTFVARAHAERLGKRSSQ